jgi:hypothetical protein
MKISNYLCFVVGEQPEKMSRLHESTLRRIRTFAIAIHIPVAIWAVTSYLIASRIFELSNATSFLTAMFCSTLIYLVERIVLATPKAWYVMLGRLFIGVIISVLGASAFDLIVFEREIASQLRDAGATKIAREQGSAVERQDRLVAQKKADWHAAMEKANCEANGTCGSRVRSIGPVYRQLARQAETLRSDFLAAQTALRDMQEQHAAALVQWRQSNQALDEAGLLERVEALHQFISRNQTAFAAWVLLFSLVLAFELMVVLAKWVFSDTVDDYLVGVREQLSRQQADDYVEAIRSPTRHAQHLLGVQA